MYLVITIRFLGDRYHGRTENGREPEWPPSPLRLYQAIISGAASRWHDPSLRDRELQALRWLESFEAPSILAPRVRKGRPLLSYVPENLSDVDPQKRDAKVSRPTLFCGEPKVVYYWSLDSRSAEIAHIVARCAARCRALGWGVDMVVGSGVIEQKEPEFPTGEKWVPATSDNENVALRVPRGPTEYRTGTLEQLQTRYAASLERIASDGRNPVPPLTAFRIVGYRRTAGPLPRPYAPFEFPEDVAFRQTAANEVAAMVRSVACQFAKRDTHGFPGGSETFVAGHVNGAKVTPPRFSYLPLPTIGHRHADGMIRRVLIAEPFGGDGSHARWVQSRLRNASLKDNEGKEKAVLLGVWRASSRRIIDRYVRESTTWTSVTPVILSGFDNCEYDKAVKLCLDCLRQAEVPMEGVKELLLRKAPFWPGSLHPSQYRRPLYLRQLPAWHLRLVFRESVSGPLAVGAGRHCGFGVMAATVES